MNPKPIDLLTSEEWNAMNFKFSDISFLEVLSKLEGAIINSEQDIYKLYQLGGYLQEGFSFGQFCPTEPNYAVILLKEIISQTDKNSNSSFCDLGVGTGFVQATFAALGLRTYSVDISEKAIEYSKGYFERIQTAFKKEFRFKPIVEHLDIYEKNITNHIFSDGKKLKEIDMFYSNISEQTDFKIRIMKNLEGINSGAIFLEQYLMIARLEEYWPSVLETSFRPIDYHNARSFLISK